MTANRRWEDQHWFWRGFQSAVFLYVSCGPCLSWREQRRQKDENKRDRRARAKEAKEFPDHPNQVRQPAPFEVNPHWEEEIRLGPDLRKGRNRGNTKASRETNSSGTLGASDTAGSSTSDLVREKTDQQGSWNSRRYQRPDEEFRYVDTVDERHEMIYAPQGMHRQGSSVGVGGWAVKNDREAQRKKQKTVDKPKKAFELRSRAPPVNDLHPPVVSTVPVKKDERAWMTEPPPSVAFMHGKKGVTTRARSGSGTSSLKNGDAHLGRQVGHKLVEGKVKKGKDAIYGIELDPTAKRVDSKHHDTDNTASAPLTRTESPAHSFRLAQDRTSSSPRKSKRRPAPLFLGTGVPANTAAVVDTSEADTNSSSESSMRQSRSRTRFQSINRKRASNNPALNSHPVTPRSQKPITPLTSAISPGLSPSSTLHPEKDAASTPASPVADYTPSPRRIKTLATGPILVKDSSLHILQDLVDSNALIGNSFIKSPVIEARVPLPVGDSPKKENTSPSAKEKVLNEKARRWSISI